MGHVPFLVPLHSLTLLCTVMPMYVSRIVDTLETSLINSQIAHIHRRTVSPSGTSVLWMIILLGGLFLPLGPPFCGWSRNSCFRIDRPILLGPLFDVVSVRLLHGFVPLHRVWIGRWRHGDYVVWGCGSLYGSHIAVAEELAFDLCVVSERVRDGFELKSFDWCVMILVNLRVGFGDCSSSPLARFRGLLLLVCALHCELPVSALAALRA